MSYYDEDDGFSGFLSDLLEGGHIPEGAAEGVTRQVIDKGLDSLTEKQRIVFRRDVEPLFPGECSRAGCEIPWCESYEALNNGGLCGWCAKMKENADRD